MKPTVGRIVHYRAYNNNTKDNQPFAAIIVKVWSDTCVNLQVFDDGADGPELGLLVGDQVALRTSVPFDDSPSPTFESWSWPPRS